MQNRFLRFLENFIVVVIVLVLIQTLLEDIAILANWPIMTRQLLMILGFAFDVLFTVEFLARFIFAASKGDAGAYFFEERGWIDLLASVPLLLFNSGPEFFAFLTSTGSVVALGGILQILKVVKAIRIARVLRFLRVLKIFRRIKNADAVMAQRHVARIATIVVATMVIMLLGSAVVESLLTVPDEYLVYKESTQSAVEYIKELDSTSDPKDPNNPSATSAGLIASYADSIPIILLVRKDGKALFSRYSNEEFARHWTISDYAYILDGSLEVFIDITNLNVSDAKSNVRFFLVIMALVLVIMFIYSPHFALTISDPIHVMRKGFDEMGYNLQVRIPDQFKNDEIYLLASSYNRNFLPLKDREGESTSILQLSMDELTNFTGEEETPGGEKPSGETASGDGIDDPFSTEE